MVDIESTEAKTLETTVKTQQATIDSYKDLIAAYKDQIEAGIPLTQMDHNIRIKQSDIIMEGQQALDEGPNSEQTASLVQDAVNQEVAVEQAESEATRRLTVPQPSVR